MNHESNIKSQNKKPITFWTLFNLDELLFDLFILGGILFLHSLIVPAGETVIDVLNPTTAMLFLSSIYFFISFYFGSVLQRLKNDTNHHPVLFILVLINFVLILGAFGANPYIYLVDKGLFDEDSAIVPMFFGIVLLISFGIMSAYSKIVKDVAGPFKKKSGSTFLFIIIRILLPITLALMLGFWQEIMIACSYLDASDKIIVSPIVFNLIFGGVIPMRIIMAIVPPYRLINIIPGIITLGILIFEIFSKLSGAG